MGQSRKDQDITHRVCKICGQDKPIGEYYKRVFPNGYIWYDHSCNPCRILKGNTRYYQDKKDDPDRIRLNQRNTSLRVKYEVFDNYGGRCKCCGESDYRFLTIDHINGGGRKHRETLNKWGHGSGYGFYKWIRDNNYPTDLQLLCYNCNCGKQHNGGVCPHHSIPFHQEFIRVLKYKRRPKK